MKKNKIIKFNLLENAKSSLRHAVTHLTNDDEITADDYKYAILDIVHSIELLFKEKLKRVHPAFIWKNIDRYPDKKEYTVTLDIAKNRLIRMAGVQFADKHTKNLEAIKKLRNEIEHYEFEGEIELVKSHIGRMMSFIFWFSEEYLELKWEEEFKNDDSWWSLINMYQFFEEHVAVIEERMFKEKRAAMDCPECGAYTFDLDNGSCQMCGESQQVDECENCGQRYIANVLHEYDRQVDKDHFVKEKLCDSCATPPFDND